MKRPNIYITVAGVPWQDLTDDHRRKIIKRNTDVVAEIVTREVVSMAERGISLKEIKEFLKI